MDLPLALAAVLALILAVAPASMILMDRRSTLGACLGVLAGGAALSAAALASVVLRTSFLPWVAVTVAALYGAAAFRLIRASSAPRESVDDGWPTVGLAAASLPLLAILARAPIAWDAQSIWFFHARWLADPANVYLDISEAYGFSHPDYPPLTAASGAVGLLIAGFRNDWVLQLTTGALTLAATAALVLIIARPLRNRSRRIAFGGLAGVAVFGVVAPFSFDGHADGLLAVLLGMVAFLAFDDEDTTAVVVACLAAGMTKNEGLLFLCLVMVPAYAFARRSVIGLLPGIALGTGWAIAIRFLVDTESWQLANALPWSGAFVERLGLIAFSFATSRSLIIGVVLWVGALLIVRGTAYGDTAVRVLVGCGAVAAGMLALLTIVYLATTFDPQQRFLGLVDHLDASASRVLLPPAVVLCASALGATARSLSRNIGAVPRTPVS